MTNTKPFIDSFMKAHQGRNERYSKPIQLEFNFNADAAGTLDDPNHDWELGCTEDPSTCENLVICLCEEEANRLKRVNQEGGKNEKSN